MRSQRIQVEMQGIAGLESQKKKVYAAKSEGGGESGPPGYRRGVVRRKRQATRQGQQEDETQRRGRDETISACYRVVSLEGLSMINSTMIGHSLGDLM